MQNRGFVVLLTTIISLLCVYYLSFTWVSMRVQRQATLHATDEQGHIDFTKKQAYLDDLWKQPVYNLLGLRYTYEQVKERELSLGLDLQGGMHVTLEISPIELIKSLSGDSQDPSFLAALKQAQQQSNASQASFTTLFYQAYRAQSPEGKLSSLFATAANRSYVTYESSNKEILKFLDRQIEGAIDRSFEIIRTRIDRFGTSQPNIQHLPGTGRIQIELPGVSNPERVRKLLEGVARLRFWEVYDIQDLREPLQAVYELLSSEQTATSPEAKASEAASDQTTESTTASVDGADQAVEQPKVYSDSMPPFFSSLKAGYGFVYFVDDVPAVQATIARSDIKALLPNNLLWLWSVKPQILQDGTEALSLYPVRQRRGGQAALEGDVITDARQEFDSRGKPAVSMQMNSSGARAWKRVTANNIGQCIAIALDDHVYSAPVVNTEIPNGSSQITGNFTIEEAKDLANILKAGSLPAPVRIVEEAIIGPTLGKKAQAQGIASMLLGLGLVVLFMVLYYAKGGFIANIALLFNILFILGVLAQLNASLTLPGIAGIVLTIGMSIDANVLIFERIREELKAGALMRAAISRGYQKAYSSIIDANVTTFLTGAILYFVGQGPVRGFATTLMVGIVSSFFSAVFITRVIMSWLEDWSREGRLTFSFSYSKNLLSSLNIDFLKLRYLAYAASTVFIGAGLALIMHQGGLNLGVDFTGGRSFVVAFSQPVEPSVLKTQLAERFDDQGTEVKTYGANNVLKITTSYLVQEEGSEVDAKVQQTLIDGIRNVTGLTYTRDVAAMQEQSFAIASTAKVGATIAGDIKAAARYSILLSLVMIFFYILVRFQKWQFGLAAVIALFHDSLIVFSAFAIARACGYAFEIDQVFIAAILTIIGYSINDTVVVFDRVRERLGKGGKDSLLEVANRSINETMSRTLITSLTTFIAVFILFVFGGEVLRGFSFALLIGVVFGTYSSIFIATPLVIDFSRKVSGTGLKKKS